MLSRVLLAVAALSLSLPAQPPGAAVTITRLRESTPSRIILMVRVEGRGMALGSYQGRLRFDPAVLMVDSVLAGTDGTRLVSTTALARGEVRFGGLTPTGFRNTDAVRIVAHSARPLAAAKVNAWLEVAGDLEGRRVAKTALVASPLVDGDK